MRVHFPLLGGYFRAGLGGVTVLTVQTEDMKTQLSERWNIDRHKITVIPSAVDPFEGRTVAARPPAGTGRVCCITSTAEHKNLAILPQVAARLSKRAPRVRIALSQRQIDVPRLVTSARALNCMDVFEFVGCLGSRGVEDLLLQSDVALIPSQLESFGFHYFEAMICGCPIVAADRGFAREACEDAALYADARSADAVAAAILTILEDAALARHLSHAGPALIARRRGPWSLVGYDYATLLRGIA